MAVTWTPHAESAPRGRAPAESREPQVQIKMPLRPGPAFEQLAQRVRAEYREMPGLNVTREQAQCLWGLPADLCDEVLRHLVATGFLTRTWHDTYVRADLA